MIHLNDFPGVVIVKHFLLQQDLAAEAMKAGVNVGAVTADVAANAKSTAKYFGGNVKALKKGDEIYYDKAAGFKIEIKKEEYKVIKEFDVVVVL